MLCSNVKKIVGNPFPIVVGQYSCSSRLDAHNLVKSFERNIKLLYYEVLRPQYDPINFVRDNLKLGYTYRLVLDIEDFWSRCLNKYQNWERFWSLLTLIGLNSILILLIFLTLQMMEPTCTPHLTRRSNTPQFCLPHL